MLSPSFGLLTFLILLALLLIIDVSPRRVAPQPVKERQREDQR